MPNKTPPSYDEISRTTVPDPIGTFKPSKEQVEAAHDGTHTRAVDDQKLTSAVQAALGSQGNVRVEVRDGRVELHGSVTEAGAITDLEERARGVEGVSDVTNKLVVGS